MSIWLRGRDFTVRWYEWLLAILGLLLLMFSLQNYWATRAEHWSIGTAYTFLVVFGIPALVLIALSIFLTGWRYFRFVKAPRPAARS